MEIFCEATIRVESESELTALEIFLTVEQMLAPYGSLVALKPEFRTTPLDAGKDQKSWSERRRRAKRAAGASKRKGDRRKR
jgi:hypothetical protein